MGLFGRSKTLLKKKKKEEPSVSGPVLTSNAPQMNTTPIGSTSTTSSTSSSTASTSASTTSNESSRTRNDGQCFGIPFPEDATTIPPVLEQCFNEIKERGLHTTGIFRLSANTTQVDIVKDQFDTGATVSLSQYDPHVLANVLKYYFKHVPKPLFGEQAQYSVLRIQETDGAEDRAFLLHKFIRNNNFSSGHLLVLEHICRFFRTIVDHEKSTKLKMDHVANLLGPTLLNIENTGDYALSELRKTLTAVLLDNIDFLFSPEVKPKSSSANSSPQKVESTPSETTTTTTTTQPETQSKTSLEDEFDSPGPTLGLGANNDDGFLDMLNALADESSFSSVPVDNVASGPIQPDSPQVGKTEMNMGATVTSTATNGTPVGVDDDDLSSDEEGEVPVPPVRHTVLLKQQSALQARIKVQDKLTVIKQLQTRWMDVDKLIRDNQEEFQQSQMQELTEKRDKRKRHVRNGVKSKLAAELESIRQGYESLVHILMNTLSMQQIMYICQLLNISQRLFDHLENAPTVNSGLNFSSLGSPPICTDAVEVPPEDVMTKVNALRQASQGAFQKITDHLDRCAQELASPQTELEELVSTFQIIKSAKSGLEGRTDIVPPPIARDAKVQQLIDLGLDMVQDVQTRMEFFHIEFSRVDNLDSALPLAWAIRSMQKLIESDSNTTFQEMDLGAPKFPVDRSRSDSGSMEQVNRLRDALTPVIKQQVEAVRDLQASLQGAFDKASAVPAVMQLKKLQSLSEYYHSTKDAQEQQLASQNSEKINRVRAASLTAVNEIQNALSTLQLLFNRCQMMDEAIELTKLVKSAKDVFDVPSHESLPVLTPMTRTGQYVNSDTTRLPALRQMTSILFQELGNVLDASQVSLENNNDLLSLVSHARQLNVVQKHLKTYVDSDSSIQFVLSQQQNHLSVGGNGSLGSSLGLNNNPRLSTMNLNVNSLHSQLETHDQGLGSSSSSSSNMGIGISTVDPKVAQFQQAVSKGFNELQSSFQTFAATLTGSSDLQAVMTMAKIIRGVEDAMTQVSMECLSDQVMPTSVGFNSGTVDPNVKKVQMLVATVIKNCVTKASELSATASISTSMEELVKMAQLVRAIQTQLAPAQ